jgi:hypothetical protein
LGLEDGMFDQDSGAGGVGFGSSSSSSISTIRRKYRPHVSLQCVSLKNF